MSKLDEMTLGEIKEAARLIGAGACAPADAPLAKRGDKVYIQTAVWAYCGEVVDVTPSYIEMVKVSWIAVTNRRGDFMAGEISEEAEIEVYPADMVTRVPIGCVTEVGLWPHPLPDKTQ